MSGRKKNRKHHRSQPPQELLNELNSLRELLGSEEAEADIPLLDQVAESPTSDRPPQQPTQPLQPPRPLEEADLPILFSPLDEEPEDDFAAELSETDRELLRPLQSLPRIPEPTKPLQDTPADTGKESAPPHNSNTDQAQQEDRAEQSREPRKEFQPELFDDNRASATASPVPKQTALTDNPFLPPHIRARLTGGKIPRPQAEAAEPAEAEALAVKVDGLDAPPEHTKEIEAVEEDDTRLNKQEREALIEQLMAEQLPELEQQLRLSITLMVDGLYSQKD